MSRERYTAILFTSPTPEIDRAGLKDRKAIVAQMADDCRATAATCGALTRDDLETLGWSPDQVATYAKEAAAQARREAVR